MYVGKYVTFCPSKKTYTSGKRQIRQKIMYVFRCDSCNDLFARRKRKLHNAFDMCSKSCYRRENAAGGMIRKHTTQAFLRENGVGTIGHEMMQKRRERTCIERYGVRHGSQSTDVQQRFMNTLLKRYGVVSSFLTPKAVVAKHDPRNNVKRHETMKRNGTYGKSRPEDGLYAILCERFGADNVERQVVVNGWSIDFYVHTIDTYIQLDGVYWHGLDRPRHVLESSMSPRDAVILRTYQIDQEQNAWFRDNGLRLVRITDKQFRSGQLAVLAI
jgi:hypothetical protein